MLVKSLGEMKALYMCPNVSLKIMGADFWARLIVLESKDLDVILVMDWLGMHEATIQCAKRTVLLTGPKGEKVELVADPPSDAGGSVQQLDGVDGVYPYQTSYGFASGQIPHRSQGTLLPSSGEPKVSNPWNNVQRK
jgi:hypothetical protein